MKVLVVDDEEIMRVSLQNALKDAGHHAEACDGAEEALCCLRRKMFDVAVVDVVMPGMSGMEFLEVVGRDFPGIAVIMMTAYGTVETAVNAMKEGAHDYLTKPFDTGELIQILEHL